MCRPEPMPDWTTRRRWPRAASPMKLLGGASQGRRRPLMCLAALAIGIRNSISLSRSMLRSTLATLVSRGRVRAPLRDQARLNGSIRLSDCVCDINWPGKRASIPWRCRRLWRRQRFHMAALRRLCFRLLGVKPSRRSRLSRVGCRLHPRRPQQEQPRLDPAWAGHWIKLPLVVGP